VGTAEAAMTGAVFVLIERGDDEEITSRQVFQVQEPVALDGTCDLNQVLILLRCSYNRLGWKMSPGSGYDIIYRFI
jgi:hypothetical protein